MKKALSQRSRKVHSDLSSAQSVNGIPNSVLADVFSGKRGATSEMMGHREELVPSIAAKMSQAFGMDVSGVQVYRSDAMAGTEMHGMAQGNKVVLSSDVDLNTLEGQAILGHELSHIRAQSMGMGMGNSGLLNDSALEHQADSEGLLAARGMRIGGERMGMSMGLGMAGVEGLTPIGGGLGASAGAPMQADKDLNKYNKLKAKEHRTDDDNAELKRLYDKLVEKGVFQRTQKPKLKAEDITKAPTVVLDYNLAKTKPTTAEEYSRKREYLRSEGRQGSMTGFQFLRESNLPGVLPKDRQNGGLEARIGHLEELTYNWLHVENKHMLASNDVNEATKNAYGNMNREFNQSVFRNLYTVRNRRNRRQKEADQAWKKAQYPDENGNNTFNYPMEQDREQIRDKTTQKMREKTKADIVGQANAKNDSRIKDIIQGKPPAGAPTGKNSQVFTQEKLSKIFPEVEPNHNGRPKVKPKSMTLKDFDILYGEDAKEKQEFTHKSKLGKEYAQKRQEQKKQEQQQLPEAPISEERQERRALRNELLYRTDTNSARNGYKLNMIYEEKNEDDEDELLEQGVKNTGEELPADFEDYYAGGEWQNNDTWNNSEDKSALLKLRSAPKLNSDDEDEGIGSIMHADKEIENKNAHKEDQSAITELLNRPFKMAEEHSFVPSPVLEKLYLEDLVKDAQEKEDSKYADRTAQGEDINNIAERKIITADDVRDQLPWVKKETSGSSDAANLKRFENTPTIDDIMKIHRKHIHEPAYYLSDFFEAYQSYIRLFSETGATSAYVNQKINHDANPNADDDDDE